MAFLSSSAFCYHGHTANLPFTLVPGMRVNTFFSDAPGTTIGTFLVQAQRLLKVESASCVAQRGHIGLTLMVVAKLFLVALFSRPFLS